MPEQSRTNYVAFSPDGTQLIQQAADRHYVYAWDLRALRHHLAALHLDMKLPPCPEPAEPADGPPPPPLRVTVQGAELVRDPVLLRREELWEAALAWRADPFDADANRRLGVIAIQEQRWGAAFAHLTVARLFHPEDFETRRMRAWAALQVGHRPEALVDAEWVLRQQPGDSVGLLVRGRVLQALGRHAGAVADFTALLRSFPADVDVYADRARSYDALQDRARRDADRHKADQLALNDPRRLNARAWRLVAGPTSERNPRLALELARKAVARVPDSQEYLNTLGVAQYRNGLHREAVATFHKSLRAGRGQFDASDLFFQAMAYQRLGEAAKARDCYDRAVKWWHARKALPAPYVEELRAFRQEADALLKRGRDGR